MSDLDNLIVGFKQNMARTGQYVGGDDQTDVDTPAGPVPSIAKQARLAREATQQQASDLSQRLRLDIAGNYTAAQMLQGLKNLGIERINNTADADKPISTLVQQAIDQLVIQINSKENPANRNKPNGYVGLVGNKIPLRNNADSFTSLFTSDVTAARTWVMPDLDGTIALKSDITGTNSGTNTGDETAITIRSKLGITTLSGANTGDETNTTILNKLGLTSISGVNTGDEDRTSIINKIGYDVMPLGARGAVDGVAPLGDNRLIPEQYLPPAFQTVEVDADIGSLPAQGVQGRLYVTQAESGLFYWNGVTYMDLKAAINTTDQLAEGGNHLYFTTLRVLQTTLAGFDDSDASAVLASDTILKALGKLHGQTTTNALQILTKENTSNKATDFTIIDDVKYPSVKAVKTYLDTRLASVVNDQGSWDASGNAWPTAGSLEGGGIKKGDFWYVKVAGKLGGVDVNQGDSFRALSDNPGNDASKWDVLESNLGFVPYNSTNPAGYTANQTDAYLLDRTHHTGTQSADTITDSSTRVMVSPAEKTAITHSNRAALDLVTGTNTGDETLTTIKNKLGSTSNLPEGTNLYYTDSRVMSATLTSYSVAAANAAITVTDSIPVAFGKHQKQINDLQAANTGTNTGDETLASIKSKLGSTSNLPEGSNLYYQDSRVLAAVLTGYTVATTNAAVAAADNIPTAFGKTQKQINDLKSANTGTNTGDETSGTIVNKLVGQTVAVQALTVNGNTVMTTATGEALSNKATDFSTANNTLYPSVLAVKTYVDAALVGVLNDRGTYNASTNTYPTSGGSGAGGAIRKGDFWYVGTAGTLGGVAVNIGDSFRALVDAPGQTAANWAQLEANIGYVPVNAATLGQASGVATLGSDGILATAQRPTTAGIIENTNLYFTTGRVLATALTGYAVGTATAVTTSDTVLSAIGKLQAQVSSGSSGKAAAGVNNDITALQALTAIAAGVTAPGILANTNTIAAAGITQATAAAATQDISYVNGGAVGTATGVVAVSANAGRSAKIINRNSFAIQVYPQTGQNFDLLAANLAVTLPANSMLEMTCALGGSWVTSNVVSVGAAAIQAAAAAGNGANTWGFAVNGAIQASVSGNANAVSRVNLRGGTSGVGPAIDAVSSETDAHLILNAQGAGQIITNYPLNIQNGVLASEIDKGTQSTASATVTFNVKAGSVQKVTIAAATTIATTGWPGAGSYAELFIELVNGGAAAVTFTGISWILPTTGQAAASFSAYLTAIGRSPASLQTSGTDWIVLWSTNGGSTIYGKVC